jgi:hypothetical protein
MSTERANIYTSNGLKYPFDISNFLGPSISAETLKTPINEDCNIFNLELVRN